MPAPWLALGVVFLIGFRIALNVTDSNVIDVGYAGVIGAQRIVDGKPLYGAYPADNEHGDTYGPVNYEAYVPFEQLFGWSGTWDDLPAAHAAAIVFDLLAIGAAVPDRAPRARPDPRRSRSPTPGSPIPFTLFALESNSNDTLVAVLVLAALLAATYRSRLAPPARGAFAALAGLTKFAPLALAPLLATHGLWERLRDGSRATRARVRDLVSFAARVRDGRRRAREHPGAHARLAAHDLRAHVRLPGQPRLAVLGVGAVRRARRLAGGRADRRGRCSRSALAVVPRRADVVGLAAACAAVIIAAQLGIEHWFYLYIPWFFPLVMIALLGRFGPPGRRGEEIGIRPSRRAGLHFSIQSCDRSGRHGSYRGRPSGPAVAAVAASAPARSSRPAVAVSS